MNFLNSIRGRLALVSALVIALVLGIAGFGQAALFRSYLDQRIGQELKNRILDVAGAFLLDTAKKPNLSRAPFDPRYRNPYGGAYWYVRDGGATILRSRSMWDAELVAPGDKPNINVVSVTGPGETLVYLLEQPVTLGESGDQRNFIIGVAVDAAEAEELASGFTSQTTWALLLMGITLFGGAWLQANYGLQPLTRIREQLAQLHNGEADQLAGPFPSEVDGLARELNALFGQQKQSLTKARESAGALAHGLKTPMTILYGETRNLERASHSAAVTLRQQLDLIQKQVDRTLVRSRSHGVSAGIGLHADFTETASRLVGLMQRMPRGDTIEWQLPPHGISIAMDSDDLGEVLGNLLDNARKWAKSRVVISATIVQNGLVSVSISDDGPGPGARHLDDDVRNSSGLGLKIVSDLLSGYGSGIVIEGSSPGTIARFEIAGFAAKVEVTSDL